jgi:hypothetical protein
VAVVAHQTWVQVRAVLVAVATGHFQVRLLAQMAQQTRVVAEVVMRLVTVMVILAVLA